MIIRRNMVRLLCVTSLSVALIFTTGAFAFAVDIPDAADRIMAENAADIVEGFVEADEINEVVDAGNAFVDDSGDWITTIPKDGSDFVTMEDKNGVSIGMSLPKGIEIEDGVATDTGTVVYQTDESVDVCVQSVKEEQDGIIIDGIRELVTIKDKDAPKKYSFNFDLPKGYSLVTSEEYCSRWNKKIESEDCKMEVEPGYVYIVDGSDEIQTVIDAPWARDANGNEVVTSYTIDGHTLFQYVEFNENSEFPIVADPKEGDTKTLTKYLTKKNVKKTRDKYSPEPMPSFWKSFMNNFGGNVPAFGTVWSIANFLNERVNATSYTTWNKLYTKFPKNKNRLQVVVKYRWHHKGAWVATGNAKYTYVQYT